MAVWFRTSRGLPGRPRRRGVDLGVVRIWSARHSFTVVIGHQQSPVRDDLEASSFGPYSHLHTTSVNNRYCGGVRALKAVAPVRIRSGLHHYTPQFLGGVAISGSH
jgi:hypothetical protein